MVGIFHLKFCNCVDEMETQCKICNSPLVANFVTTSFPDAKFISDSCFSDHKMRLQMQLQIILFATRNKFFGIARSLISVFDFPMGRPTKYNNTKTPITNVYYSLRVLSQGIWFSILGLFNLLFEDSMEWRIRTQNG